jgi:hypothetical protein
MSDDGIVQPEGRVVRLSPEATTICETRATQLGITVPEYIRRCLGLGEMALELRDGDELMIKHSNGKFDRVLFPENRPRL